MLRPLSRASLTSSCSLRPRILDEYTPELDLFCFLRRFNNSNRDNTISKSNELNHRPMLRKLGASERPPSVKKLPPDTRNKLAAWLDGLRKGTREEKKPLFNNRWTKLLQFETKGMELSFDERDQHSPYQVHSPLQSENPPLQAFSELSPEEKEIVSRAREFLRVKNEAELDVSSATALIKQNTKSSSLFVQRTMRALTCRLIHCCSSSETYSRVTTILQAYKPDLALVPTFEDGTVLNALIIAASKAGKATEALQWFHLIQRDLDDDLVAGQRPLIPTAYTLTSLFNCLRDASKASDAFIIYADLVVAKLRLSPTVYASLVKAVLSDRAVFDRWRKPLIDDLQRRVNVKHLIGYSRYPIFPDTAAHVALIEAAVSRSELHLYLRILDSITALPESESLVVSGSPRIEQRLRWKLWSSSVSSSLISAFVRFGNAEEALMLLSKLALLNQCSNQLFFHSLQVMARSNLEFSGNYVNAVWSLMHRYNITPSNTALRIQIRSLTEVIQESADTKKTVIQSELRKVIADANRDLQREELLPSVKTSRAFELANKLLL